jgi:hypothetical protein
MKKLIEKIPGEYVPWIGIGIAVVLILGYHFLVESIF